MHLIQIYDPALCCSTGVCGVEVDQSLVTFASDVEWAIRQGANVQRFNLAHEPQAGDSTTI
ncbi:arsenic metallochaperone ArsD family protein, partial [Pseudomonas aeruginosa]